MDHNEFSVDKAMKPVERIDGRNRSSNAGEWIIRHNGTYFDTDDLDARC
jgi:hypothetical protein